jgi:hypothetical protein
MMIGYDIYDHFTMEHFRLRQSMILTSFFFARDSSLHDFFFKQYLHMFLCYIFVFNKILLNCTDEICYGVIWF